MRLLLAPFAWLYGGVVTLRNAAFDAGLLRIESAGVPTVSVGNMTAGGTGKTPLVEYLVGWFQARGRTVGVVSRGYGRETTGVLVVSSGSGPMVTARQGGDEPVQIAGRFPAARIVVGERRVDAARLAVDRLGADLLIMDDGFQHRYLRRDLDIVVADAGKDLRREPLLPAGRRREPLSSLRRAHAVGFSRVDTAGATPLPGGIEERWCPRVRFGYTIRIRSVMDPVAGTDVPLHSLDRKRVVAFSGIGNHAAFLAELRTRSFSVVADRRYGDHHWYADGDAAELAAIGRTSSAAAFVTTQKDHVRAQSVPGFMERLRDVAPVLVAGVDVEIIRGRAELEALLEGLMARGGRA